MLPLWQTLRGVTDCTFAFKAHMCYSKLSSGINSYILLVVMNHNLSTNQTGRNTIESSFYFNASVNIYFADAYCKKHKGLLRQGAKTGTFDIAEQFPHLTAGSSVNTGTCPSFVPVSQICISFFKTVK